VGEALVLAAQLPSPRAIFPQDTNIEFLSLFYSFLRPLFRALNSRRRVVRSGVWPSRYYATALKLPPSPIVSQESDLRGLVPVSLLQDVRDCQLTESNLTRFHGRRTRSRRAVISDDQPRIRSLVRLATHRATTEE
jgi:hypothetical protein